MCTRMRYAYYSNIIRIMLIRNTNKHTTNNYTIYYTHYFLTKIVKENSKILDQLETKS